MTPNTLRDLAGIYGSAETNAPRRTVKLQRPHASIPSNMAQSRSQTFRLMEPDPILVVIDEARREDRGPESVANATLSTGEI